MRAVATSLLPSRSRGHRSRPPFPALCSAACAAPRRSGNGSDTARLRWNSVRDQPGPRCQESTRSDSKPAPSPVPPRPSNRQIDKQRGADIARRRRVRNCGSNEQLVPDLNSTKVYVSMWISATEWRTSRVARRGNSPLTTQISDKTTSIGDRSRLRSTLHLSLVGGGLDVPRTGCLPPNEAL